MACDGSPALFVGSPALFVTHPFRARFCCAFLSTRRSGAFLWAWVDRALGVWGPSAPGSREGRGWRESGLSGRTAQNGTCAVVLRLLLFLCWDPVARQTWRDPAPGQRWGTVLRGGVSASISSAKPASSPTQPKMGKFHFLRSEALFVLSEFLLPCSYPAPWINFLSPASTSHLQREKTAP